MNTEWPSKSDMLWANFQNDLPIDLLTLEKLALDKQGLG